jgi:hypothetical protein
LWFACLGLAVWQSISGPASVVWVVALLVWGFRLRRIGRLWRDPQPPMEPFEAAMRATCARYGADFVPTAPGSVVRIVGDVRAGARPLGGRRLTGPDRPTWFVWVGDEPAEASPEAVGVHAALLFPRCPEVAAMLGLPEGWSFRLTADREEVRRGRDRVNPTAAELTAEVPRQSKSK